MIAPPPTNKLSGEQIVLVFCSDVCIIITIKLELTFTNKSFIFRDNIFISATKNHPIILHDLLFSNHLERKQKEIRFFDITLIFYLIDQSNRTGKDHNYMNKFDPNVSLLHNMVTNNVPIMSNDYY